MVVLVYFIVINVGFDVFKGGGNVIDVVVVMVLMFGVVDGYNLGIGGGCFILICIVDGELFVIDGCEVVLEVVF